MDFQKGGQVTGFHLRNEEFFSATKLPQPHPFRAGFLYRKVEVLAHSWWENTISKEFFGV